MINLDDAEAKHAEAMQHASAGFLAADQGEAEALFRLAWESERKAAMLLADSTIEPTRSVLFRSAAVLALKCGEHEDAKHLARMGLEGAPSQRVRESLEKVLED